MRLATPAPPTGVPGRLPSFIVGNQDERLHTFAESSGDGAVWTHCQDGPVGKAIVHSSQALRDSRLIAKRSD